MQKCVAFLNIFTISPVTNAPALMRGRAVFVYHNRRHRRSVDGTLLPCSSDGPDRPTYRQSRVFIHHVHSTPPLILIVLSRLHRGIQSATEGQRVLRVVLTVPRVCRYASC